VETASQRSAGFTLVWGPPGTGKSSTLVALINALHLREYERLHAAVESIVLGNGVGGDASAQWQAAVRHAPRLLVTASSNTAVQGLLDRVQSKKLQDRRGNLYEPWGIVRVGSDRGGDNRFDLDARVNALLAEKQEHVAERLATVSSSLRALKVKVVQLREEIRKLNEAVPLPKGWEARISDKSDLLEFHDHAKQRATWRRPEVPPPGAPSVGILDMPHAVSRLGELIHCADRWWQLQGEEQRLTLLAGRSRAPPRELREQLQGSLLGTAQLVFATANSAARLRPSARSNEPFGAVVVDEAGQATEPSLLVPLELARSDRCVLVGDDRQLPPTVFMQRAEEALLSRTLFERLRLCGHLPELLDLQYRMAPEISAWPRHYFYGGALHDAPAMLERPRPALNAVVPPLLFLDLGSSKVEKSPCGSWRNVGEARLCSELLALIREAAAEVGEESVAADVGVITPYRAQQETLRQQLRRAGLPLEPRAVQTVDGFQGRECEVVLFSTVRAPESATSVPGIGFVADERRINVALTRAKSILVVIGHAQTLGRSPAWAAFLRHVRSVQGGYQQVGPNLSSVDLKGLLRVHEQS